MLGSNLGRFTEIVFKAWRGVVVDRVQKDAQQQVEEASESSIRSIEKRLDALEEREDSSAERVRKVGEALEERVNCLEGRVGDLAGGHVDLRAHLHERMEQLEGHARESAKTQAEARTLSWRNVWAGCD